MPCGPGTTPRSIGDTALKQPGHRPEMFKAGKFPPEAGALSGGGGVSCLLELDEAELWGCGGDLAAEGNEYWVLVGRTLTLSTGAHWNLTLVQYPYMRIE